MELNGRKYLWDKMLFAFVLLLAAFVLLGSPLFEVREIVVTGNRQLPAAKIVELSGIVPGTNIFKQNLKEAQGRICTLPLVKEVVICRDFPSRIVINVRERQPLALLPTPGGFVQVDREGVCLQEGGVNDSFPVITGFPVSPLAPGEVVRDERLRATLQVVDRFPETLLKELSEVHINGQGQLVLYTLEGVECRLGNASNLEQKLALLQQILRQVRDRRIAYIDLSGVPVVKYAR